MTDFCKELLTIPKFMKIR